MTATTTIPRLLFVLLLTVPGGSCSERSLSGLLGGLGGAARARAQTIPPALGEGPFTAAEILEAAPYTRVTAVEQAVLRFQRGDYAGCREVLAPWHEALAEGACPPAVLYLLGACSHYSGHHEEALARFGEVLARAPLFEDHARFFSAASLAELGRTEEALALFAAVSSGSTQGRRAVEQRARLLLESRPEEASTLLADFLARRGAGDADLRLLLAEARERTGALPEAVSAYWDVWARAPLASEAQTASEAIRRLADKLPPKERRGLTTPTTAARLERGRRLYDAHRSDEAIEILGHVVKAAKRAGDEWCEAHYLSARSWDKLRRRAHAVPHYDALMKHCQNAPSRVHVLFAGGRSAHQEGLRTRALEYFDKLYREFPEHSYNDDALLRVAAIHRATGRPKQAEAALRKALDLYPDGDMREEAAWGILWDQYSAGRFAEALEWANQSLVIIPREMTYRSAGRTLYWKGRTLERMGRQELANESFRQCMVEYPLTWYSGLSFARLHAQSPEQARATFGEIVARDAAPAGPLEREIPIAITAAPAFRRGVELVRLGLHGPAVREFAALSGGDPSEAAAADWLMAALFERAGQWPRSHNIPRRRQPGFQNHYPNAHHERYWRIAYPRPYRTLARQAAAAEEVPEALVHAIMREESGFDPGIESWANAVGLMQLLVPTARELTDPDDPTINRQTLKDARLNVKLGTRFLGRLLTRFGGRPALAAAGYNAGAGRMRTWLQERGTLDIDEFVERIPFGQTRGYTIRVMESVLRYRYLYGVGPEGAGKGEMTLIDLTVSTGSSR